MFFAKSGTVAVVDIAKADIPTGPDRKGGCRGGKLAGLLIPKKKISWKDLKRGRKHSADDRGEGGRRQRKKKSFLQYVPALRGVKGQTRGG